MPSSARGIVFTGPREVLLEDFVLPDPGPQQALLRLTRTLVSAGTEVSSLLGPTAPGPTALEPSASPDAPAGRCVPATPAWAWWKRWARG